MIKINYLEPKGGLYFSELKAAFGASVDFEISSNAKDADFIVLGPGFLCDESLEKNKHLPFHKLEQKKSLFLNKEYKNLDQKIKFINDNDIEIVFTTHHHYEKWNERCPKAKFYKIPFAYNESTFKDYEQEKVHDLGFTGNLFNKGPYVGDRIMGKNFNNVRERIFNEIKNNGYYSTLNLFLGEGVYLHGEAYGRKINSTKIWICTPSAIDLVGTRFYEVMGCKTMLMSKVIDGESIYDGLFTEGEHFVGFKDDLSDFTEKVDFYLSNDSERNRICEAAYNLVREKHCWKHRVDKISEILQEKLNE
jgi:spore maturation protein CgeB